jgi:hypothetical protein
VGAGSVRPFTLAASLPAELARLALFWQRASTTGMARFTTDDATRRIDPHDDGPEAVAERLRLEMRDAVDSLRARLPEAFPRWQQRRRDAYDNTTDPQ